MNEFIRRDGRSLRVVPGFRETTLGYRRPVTASAGWSDAAYEEAADKKRRRQIVSRIAKLAEDPRPSGCQKLSGQEAYRIRQGEHRIIYTIEDGRLVVNIVKVGRRRDVYR